MEHRRRGADEGSSLARHYPEAHTQQGQLHVDVAGVVLAASRSRGTLWEPDAAMGAGGDDASVGLDRTRTGSRERSYPPAPVVAGRTARQPHSRTSNDERTHFDDSRIDDERTADDQRVAAMSGPAIDLETTLTHDSPVIETDGAIQVANDLPDASVITLSFGGEWGTLYATLTPAEAKTLATALEQTAEEAGDTDSEEVTNPDA